MSKYISLLLVFVLALACPSFANPIQPVTSDGTTGYNLPINVPLYSSGTLTSAQILAMSSSTASTMIPAPGAGKAIVLIRWVGNTVAGGTPYAGEAASCRYMAILQGQAIAPGFPQLL